MDANTNSDPFFMDATSPQIVDTEMNDTPQSFEHLFFDHAFSNDTPLYGENGYPASPFPSSMPPKPPKQPPPQQVGPNPRGASNDRTLSASSESEVQDSSSDSSGRHKRHSSSRSSHSVATGKVPAAPSGARAAMRGGFGAFHGQLPRATDAHRPRFDDMEYSNRAMEAAFDFDSAANTPSPLTSGSSIATSGPSGRFVAIPQDSPIPTSALLLPQTRASGTSDAQQLADARLMFPQGTRENSPLTQMMNSAFHPSAVHTSHTSPASSDDFLDMTNFTNKMPSFSPPKQMADAYTSPAAVTKAAPATMPPYLSSLNPLLGLSARKTPSQLIIHPTPQKSRVETQIPIKMSLFPMPAGVTRLHLPPHTVSKPKLLAKPPPEKEANMLELSTSLVCTSAMHDATKLQRALDRAIDGSSPAMVKEDTRRSSAGDAKSISDSEEDPLNGGEVHICGGCINRERKRAARKKSKKPEEEEPWQKDEAKRVIVFNTNEIKEWQEPSTPNAQADTQSEELGAQREAQQITLPDGAMQIDVPMRIACYCRHKSEKMGFQVIFTIKDYKGNLIAQTMTNPIMITDDHKTHAPAAPVVNTNGIFFDHIALPGGSMIAREPLDNYVNGLHRNAHSTNDLQALQNQFNHPYNQQVVAPYAIPHTQSQTTSTTLTPRVLSRQASPTAATNAAKKRKGSGGSIRLPDNLQMTRIQGSGPSSAAPVWPTSAGLPASPNSASPFAGTFPSNIGPAPTSQQSAQFFSSSSAPNNDGDLFSTSNRSQSFENLSQMRGMYSLPNSAHPSRAPSPTTGAQTMSGVVATSPTGVLPDSQFQAAFSPSSIVNPPRTPIIHKLIPSEGPKAGGIEVTCLGSGFSNGLEIMFGDCLATTTTFWGETSLVCLLPPASRAGTVPVTFKHQYLQMKAQRARFPGQAPPRQQVLFKYIDDDEQELLRQALLLLNQKMHGTFGEVSDIARSIVNSANGGMGSGAADGTHSQMSGHQRQSGQFDAETAVLKVLELIDLDDSPYEPKLNARRKNGQGILHLAASLGFVRLVAGLLARGANPDLRDVNGLSPMHMAAINGHPGIITRLRRARGDPRMRSLRGFTPADMAANQHALEAIQALSHNRSQSLGLPFADRSRTSSISSTVSRRRLILEESSYEHEYSDESDDEASEVPHISLHGTPTQVWARSRRNSIETETETAAGNIFPVMAMTAWRDSLATQIQQFQQSVSWNFTNLPNLQLPNLPSLPTIPENYQAGSMVRRFSSLVPQRSGSPTSDVDSRSETKENVSRVWDLLTGSATPSPAPPAYEDIYPPNKNDLDTKTASATTAAADAAADIKCAALYDEQQVTTHATPAESSLQGSRAPAVVRIRKDGVTEEERLALMAQREQRMKKLASDRKLFFIWIPMLLLVVLAVMKNQFPPLCQFAKAVSSRLEFAAQAINTLGGVAEVQ